MNPKDATRLFFRPPASVKAKFAAEVKARGMTQDAVLVGLVEWWSKQAPIVQVVVAGKVPADPDVVAAAVKRMGKKKG